MGIRDDRGRDVGGDGKYGKALQFNGSSALVTMPDAASLHLSSGMTLEAWVNPSTVTAKWRDVIYKGNDNYYLEATSTNASRPDAGMIAGGSYADAFGTAKLPANTWSYLAETYDGATLRLYVNGTQVAATAHTGTIATLDQPVADRRRQHLRPVLRRADRQRPRLQHRAHRRPDPNRPDHPVSSGPDTTPPTQPGTLTANAVSSGEVDLSWGASTDNVGVTGYKVERCSGTGCTQLRADRHDSGTGTTYKDTTVSASPAIATRSSPPTPPATSARYSNTASATTRPRIPRRRRSRGR